MKRLGVIGGLGPIATAYFFELVIEMTDATCDQENLDMVIYNTPSIPDRTSYILHKSDKNPVDKMVEVGHKLQQESVDFVAIPCITAHYFYDELSKAIHVPIINMVQETVTYLHAHNIMRVGIMATDGTIQTKLFQHVIEQMGMTAIVPSTKEQQNVMDIIYKNVKANKPVDMDKFQSASTYLKQNGAEIIILGCTELSLVKRDYTIGTGFIDAMEVLAMRSVESCGGPLKKGYQNLLIV